MSTCKPSSRPSNATPPTPEASLNSNASSCKPAKTSHAPPLKRSPAPSPRAIPPLAPCPTCQNHTQARELRFVRVQSLWGTVTLPKARYRCHTCQTQYTTFQDPNLDESGCTPLVLERAEHLSLLLPYQLACRVLHEWGVTLASSFLSQISQQLERTEQALSQTRLQALARQPLPISNLPSRAWMLEIDGMFVPTRQASNLESSQEANTESGAVWREVKTAVLYRKDTPSDRYQISTLEPVQAFAPLVHGLLRFAGLRVQDVLIGLSDGAVWIADLFADLGVHRHVLDVFHASGYLETVMVGLGWTDQERLETRRAWLRGEVDGLMWLNWHVTPAGCAGLATEARVALAYLERQAFLGRMAYPAFKREGFEVIGSGQVEGANKSVLAARLRVSGAIWSEVGADAKAFARGLWASRRRVVEFDQVRLIAFPRAA